MPGGVPAQGLERLPTALHPVRGPLRLEVGDAGARCPASGEGPIHGIFQEAAEIGRGVVFPRDSGVTVHSWAVC